MESTKRQGAPQLQEQINNLKAQMSASEIAQSSYIRTNYNPACILLAAKMLPKCRQCKQKHTLDGDICANCKARVERRRIQRSKNATI